MDHLRIVWQVGETLLESVPFREDPEGNRYNVLLAVQEMVTNVLRHAYRGVETEPIDLEMSASETGFEVVLRDHGPAFDPLAEVPEEEEQADQEFPAAEGGYGIMIARRVMDAMDYRRLGGENVLTMYKAAGAPAGARTGE